MKIHTSLLRKCLRKRYLNQAEAEQMAYLARQRGGRDSKMAAYACPFCGKWHIGHRRNRKRRMR